MTEAEIRKLAATLTDEEMRRLHSDLVLRFGARMEQLSTFMREFHDDIERIALGNFTPSNHDMELVSQLADFALFYFVNGDNRSLLNDLKTERSDKASE